MKLFGLILVLALGFSAGAQSPGELMVTCRVCHGQEGVSINDQWPNLAGQKKEYLAKQLKAFRAGTRKDPVMSPIANPLSDSEIEQLATYFSRIK